METEKKENGELFEKEGKNSFLLVFIKHYPQYLVALIVMIIGAFVDMPDTSMVPPNYMKIWALVLFALGCFFPFVISAISPKRSHEQKGLFSFSSILLLLSLFSVAFGAGAFIHTFFQFDLFNITFLAYGIGGYAGVFLSRLL